VNSWEARWSRSNPGAPPPRISTDEIKAKYPASLFGADPSTVHYAAPAPVVVAPSGGGTFGNAVMLVLGGFAVGTLFGEEWIGKALGAKHKSKI
jgi:hypothetical protein